LGDLALDSFGKGDLEVVEVEMLMVSPFALGIMKKAEFDIMTERGTEVPSRRYAKAWEIANKNRG